MNNIYLVSFLGGGGGDFLCSQISKDCNFYPLEYTINSVTNTCDLTNPFLKWNIDLKNHLRFKVLEISDVILEEIDLYYNEKNLVAPTHFFGNLSEIKLPRLKGVHLYTKQFFPLFYLLLWIKRWVLIQEFENKEIFLRKVISASSLPNDAYAKIFRDKIADNILANRNFVYEFELRAATRLFRNAIDCVEWFYRYYCFVFAFPNPHTVSKDWIPYNIDNLYLDPVNNSEEFCQLFNMEKPIDPEIIVSYYSKNLQVIEEIFGEPYEVFILGDWLSKLKKWIELKCPNSYSVDFKIL